LHFFFNCERNPERELRLKKFNRKRVCHLFSDDQKKIRIDRSQRLLLMPGMCTKHYFEGISTGEEFWFQYSSYSDSMFVHSRKMLVARIREDIFGQKITITILSTWIRLLVFKALPKGTKFNQDYVIHAIFPWLYNEKTRISRKNGFPVFQVHMDDSMDRGLKKKLPPILSGRAQVKRGISLNSSFAPYSLLWPRAPLSSSMSQDRTLFD
jgi:hypothetical protein